MSGANISVFASLKEYSLGKPTFKLEGVVGLTESKVGGWNILLQGAKSALSLPKDVILLLDDV